MDFVIKIRWNCGTERYVTGFAGRDSVSWNSEEPAYAFSDYDFAAGIVRGLNFNHLSSDLSGFACVVAVDKADLCVNPSIEDEEDNERYRFVKLQEQVRKTENWEERS